MGVPTSEVGYTPAMPRREDHEVHKGHVVALDQKKKNIIFTNDQNRFVPQYCFLLVVIRGIVPKRRAIKPSCQVPHRDIHKYTWTSPGGKTHNLIYHMLIDRRWQLNTLLSN